MLLISIIFVITGLKSISTEECPPMEVTAPCFCYDKLIYMYCSGIKSLDQFKRSVKGCQGIHVYNFTIVDSAFDYLPYDLFQHVPIQHLVISNSNFSRIGNLGEPQFKGLETSLKSLRITETFTRDHPFGYVSLDHLKNLKELDISNNYVEVLHNEWFPNGPVSLEVVRFVKGSVRRVGYKAFQPLENLKILDLSSNDINYIPRSALPEPALYLVELNLEGNQLVSLDEDFFVDMPSLKTVNLLLNEFTTIDENVWKPVWNQLSFLNINFSPLVCDSKIKWLYETGEQLEGKLEAMCYKPFSLIERDLHTLSIDELN